MDINNIKKHLVNFLKINGALGAFLLEYPENKELEELLILRKPSKFFEYADSFLRWEKTRQGVEFWLIINWRWEEYCKKHNIEK